MTLPSRDASIQELEECLDMVTAGQGDSTSAGPEGLWEILLKLADLYHQRGQIERCDIEGTTNRTL